MLKKLKGDRGVHSLISSVQNIGKERENKMKGSLLSRLRASVAAVGRESLGCREFVDVSHGCFCISELPSPSRRSYDQCRREDQGKGDVAIV